MKTRSINGIRIILTLLFSQVVLAYSQEAKFQVYSSDGNLFNTSTNSLNFSTDVSRSSRFEPIINSKDLLYDVNGSKEPFIISVKCKFTCDIKLGSIFSKTFSGKVHISGISVQTKIYENNLNTNTTPPSNYPDFVLNFKNVDYKSKEVGLDNSQKTIELNPINYKGITIIPSVIFKDNTISNDFQKANFVVAVKLDVRQ